MGGKRGRKEGDFGGGGRRAVGRRGGGGVRWMGRRTYVKRVAQHLPNHTGGAEAGGQEVPKHGHAPREREVGGWEKEERRSVDE